MVPMGGLGNHRIDETLKNETRIYGRATTKGFEGDWLRLDFNGREDGLPRVDGDRP
jgi:hypothetical protein